MSSSGYAFSPPPDKSKNDENLDTPNGPLCKNQQSNIKKPYMLGTKFEKNRTLTNTSPARLNTMNGYQNPVKLRGKITKQQQPCMKRQASMSSLSFSQPKLKKASSLVMLGSNLDRLNSNGEGSINSMFSHNSNNNNSSGGKNNNNNTHSNNNITSTGFKESNTLSNQKMLLSNRNPILQRQRSFDHSNTLFRKNESLEQGEVHEKSGGSKIRDTKKSVSSSPVKNASSNFDAVSMMVVPDRYIPASTSDKINSSMASVLAFSRLNNVGSHASNISNALGAQESLSSHSMVGSSLINNTAADDSEEEITHGGVSLIDSPPPPANASPQTHLKSINKKIFQKTVAEACGIDSHERILQYLPKAPLPSLKRSQSYSLDNNRKRYSYNDYYSEKISTIQDQFQQNTMEQKTVPGKDLYRIRKINQSPERILDCPDFIDDFYLNLISWNKRNVLAIALNQAVYLWNGDSGEVSQLLDYENETIMKVSSLTWSDDNFHISIGFDVGVIEVWDTEIGKKIRKMDGLKDSRIGVQSWLFNLISSGNKNGMIKINDVRIKNHVIQSWDDHHNNLEVCGLMYRQDGLQLASGGNDNSMIIWDTRTSLPLYIKRQHTAAVKAISWNPDIPTLLATGGGLNDQKIHFWNTNLGNRVNTINTGTQISSIHWGQSVSNKREVVITGGEPRNCISIYNYENRFKVAEINNAHDSKIISSQLSPDGTSIATIGGDENLKFFKIFDQKRNKFNGTMSSQEFDNGNGSYDDLDKRNSTSNNNNSSSSNSNDDPLKSPHKNITIR